MNVFVNLKSEGILHEKEAGEERTTFERCFNCDEMEVKS